MHFCWWDLKKQDVAYLKVIVCTSPGETYDDNEEQKLSFSLLFTLSEWC